MEIMGAAFVSPLPLGWLSSPSLWTSRNNLNLHPLHLRRQHLKGRSWSAHHGAVSMARAGTTEIKVGEIVGLEMGGKIVVAKVTGVDGMGRTADILILDQFVPELYIEGDKARQSYERVDKLRKIRAEWVPGQQGWIVLDIDRDACKKELEEAAILTMQGMKAPQVVVKEAERRKLGPEALKRQFFPLPTRRQGFIGAALSVPLSTMLYAVFYSVRQSYANFPPVEDGQASATFRQVILVLTGGSSAAALIVGLALLMLALSSVLDTPPQDS